MIAGFKKSKKNFIRKKVAVSDDEEDAADSDNVSVTSSTSNAPIVTPAVVPIIPDSTPKVKVKKKVAPKTNLSFGDELDEDEGETFVIKRSKASLKLQEKVKSDKVRKKKEKKGKVEGAAPGVVPTPAQQPVIVTPSSGNGLEIHTFEDEEEEFNDGGQVNDHIFN